MDTTKIIFLNGLTPGASFFDISTYLRKQYFDVVWGYHLLQGPPKWNPQKSIF